MRLRTKTLLVIGATLVGLVGVLYATSSTILLRSLTRAEEHNARQVVKGTINIFAETGNDLSVTAVDWAKWDDTYNFIENPNQAYIESNLIPESLTNLRVNLVLYIDKNSKIVFGTGFDLKSQKKTPIPALIQERISPKDPLLQRPLSNRSLAGLLLLPEGAMLINSQPILPTNGKGANRGALIFGRYLDAAALEKISRINRFPVTIHRLNDAKMPADFEAAQKALLQKGQIAVNATSDRTAAYTILKDIYGKPTLLLRVDIPREIYQQGKIRLRYLIASLLVVGAVFGGITLLLLERLVLSRLASLNAGVKKIGNSNDLSMRLESQGKDELSSLSDNINLMLAALEHQVRQRQESEERHRAVVEQASEGIFLVDVDTRRILEANTAFAELVGYTSTALLELTIYDVIASRRETIDQNIQRILTEKHHVLGERRYQRQDGTLVDVEVSANPISYGGREVLCIVVRDITQRKQAEAEIRQKEATLQESETRLRKQQTALLDMARCQPIYAGDLSAAWREITETATNTLDVERASVWLYNWRLSTGDWGERESGSRAEETNQNLKLVCVDLYELRNQQHTSGAELADVDYPGYFQALEADRVIAADDAHTDPRTQEFSASYLAPLGIASMLDAPIRVGGQTVGVLCLEHIGTVRRWALEEQNFASYLAYMAALAMEASDARLAEAALATSEAKFRSLILNSSDLITIFGADGITRYQSPSVFNILGYQKEDLIGINTLFMVHPNDISRVADTFQKSLDNPHIVFSCEYRFPRKDGSWCFLESTGSNLLDDPSIAGMVVNSRDITERKQAEAALRQAEERYRSIFENAVEGIFQSTLEGSYISVNPALARIYGYSSPEEMMAKITNIEQQVYVDPNRRAEFVAAMQNDNSVSRFESQVYRQDGSIIWISESARNVRNSQGQVLYYEGTVQDITERKLAEEALRYQQEQSELLLLNILPKLIAERLKGDESTIADSFAEVTVLFADIVGFTELSADTPPTKLVELLNEIFSAFDLLAEKHGLEKIKTIGDAYMVVGGLPTPRADHAEAIAAMALDMQNAIAHFNRKNDKTFSIRIGINTGPVVAGVIGIKKFIYDLWGDTVNTASRMESHGIPGEIQVTDATYELLKSQYQFQERGVIQVKGKGNMTTYLLIGKKVKNHVVL